MGSRGRKGAKETPASTASLGSQGSREPLVALDFLDPKESREILGQLPPKVRGDNQVSQVCRV